MIEIEAFEAADEYSVKLNTAAGEPMVDEAGNRAAIVVYGPGSKAYAAAQAARTQRLMTRMAGKGKNGKLTPEEQAAENALFLAACTKGFENFSYRAGTTDFAGLYGNTKLGFIAEQVGGAIGDWANFSGGSAKS